MEPVWERVVGHLRHVGMVEGVLDCSGSWRRGGVLTMTWVLDSH